MSHTPPEGFTGIDLGRSPEIFVPMQMSAQLGFEPGFTTSRTAYLPAETKKKEELARIGGEAAAYYALAL
jgi:hypothetical protein